MSKVILYIATSLDGFIADKNGGVDLMECFEHLQPVFLPNGAIDRACGSYNARKIL